MDKAACKADRTLPSRDDSVCGAIPAFASIS
jgi:hypothetical protein